MDVTRPPAPTRLDTQRMDPEQIKREQTTLWNGPAGSAWVDAQESLDRMFRRFEEMLVAEVKSLAARRVLDVGCGTGATTLAVAANLGEAGKACGIDISEPMIALARQRARRADSDAEFLVADAGTHAFDPATFDAVISRFGVMFFADPERAFANLHRATRLDGALRCIAFRSAAENPFMTTAERAAAPLLPDLPPRRTDGPGQFAFADAEHVRRILDAGGWRDVRLEPIDVECALAATELDAYLARLGPVGLALRDADDATRERVARVVRAAFDPYIHGGEVRFTAACWMIAARA